jgi:hypothetical protein
MRSVVAVTFSHAAGTFLANHYILGIEFLDIGVWGLYGCSYWWLLVRRERRRGVGSGGFLGRESWFGIVCWENRVCVVWVALGSNRAGRRVMVGVGGGSFVCGDG